MSLETGRPTHDFYKAVRWLEAAAETYAIRSATERFKKILSLEGESRPHSRRLRRAASSVLETSRTFETLKKRAALRTVSKY
jgi:hypothetical protein